MLKYQIVFGMVATLLGGCVSPSGYGGNHSPAARQEGLSINLVRSAKNNAGIFEFGAILRNSSAGEVCFVYDGNFDQLRIELLNRDTHLLLEEGLVNDVGLGGKRDIDERAMHTYEGIDPGGSISETVTVSEKNLGRYVDKRGLTISSYKHGDYLVARIVVPTGPCKLRDANHVARVRALVDVYSEFSEPFRF